MSAVMRAILLSLFYVPVLFTGLVYSQEELPRDPMAQSAEFARQLSTVEWLGPMSAIALSPFFGLACLSGVANYGPEWLTENSPLLGDLGPMRSPLLFWSMLILTIITSVPRFTKISKPIALLAETIESYSAIIILAAMKFSSIIAANAPNQAYLEAVEPLVLQAGVGAFATDIMFTLAAATNIIVINTIKLGCEFFVWLIPIPFVDSLFEAFNKTACASLALLYAYSPITAALFNLSIFIVCALIFIQVTRYLRYFKYLFVYPVMRTALGLNESEQKSFSGFLCTKWKELPNKTELRMTRLSGDRLEFIYPTWLTAYPKGIGAIKLVEPGLLADRITVLLEGERITLDIRKGTFSSSVSVAQPTQESIA